MQKNKLKKAGRMVLLVGIILCGAALSARAQRSKNLPFYDEKKLHFGFQIGLQNANLITHHAPGFVSDGDTTRYIRSLWTPGFSLGFIVNFRLADDLWALRILPNVSFYTRDVQYGYSQDAHNEVFESTFLEVPIMLKYKSVRRGNMRMYITGGFTGGWEVGSKREALSDNSLVTQKVNLSVDYGFGSDIYFEMFKFSPELRFSHGLNDMLVQTGGPYTRGLDRITTHKVTLYLNFE